MSPLFRSPVLSALARTRIQRPALQQFRTYAAVRAANAGAAAGPGWAAQWKKVGGSAMMYVKQPISYSCDKGDSVKGEMDGEV